jgi:hypothetical protein
MQIQIAQDPPPVDYIVTVAPLPAPIIIPPPPPPTTGSPIGDANGANIFRSSASDSAARFGDQALYVDNTGAYVKHIYVTPFGTTTFWNKVA